MPVYDYYCTIPTYNNSTEIVSNSIWYVPTSSYKNLNFCDDIIGLPSKKEYILEVIDRELSDI